MPSPLLLLLLFLQPALGCRTASLLECKHAPFVPGHNLVGEGFDVVKMDTRGALVVDVKEFMAGGRNKTCTLCYNKLLRQTQKIPVSVLDWRIQMKCEHSVSSRMYGSSQSVLKETSKSMGSSWKVGLSLFGLGGFAVGGTHSKTSKFVTSQASKDTFSYTSQEFKCQYYSFRLKSRPPLSQDFKMSLRGLPTKYNKHSKSAYRHFISVYGTHYIRRVKLGGRVHSTTAIRTCEVAMRGLSVRDVSDCLSVEASATVKGFTVSPAIKHCKSQSKKFQGHHSFSAVFSQRATELTGGDGTIADILFNPSGRQGYKTWLNSLKNQPGVVSYELSSLHMLVNNPSRKASLREAISDYIRSNSVSLSCPSTSCKSGRRGSNCECKCSGHSKVNSNCCSTMPGVAQLTVTVVRATGLWGDYFTKTDAYVKVSYGNHADQTGVIWNNDFPYWNRRVNFGTVVLTRRTPVRFEVWDRDNTWDDDLLGKGYVVPTRGRNVNKSFKLKHGTLYVSLSVVCGPNLSGEWCERYAAAQGSQGMLGYVLGDRDESWAWGKPTLLQEADRAENSTFL